jgi:hypothetical protein
MTTGDCDGVKKWVSNTPGLTFAIGEQMTVAGQLYEANEEITYPNGECDPSGTPMMWCANWFTLIGPC